MKILYNEDDGVKEMGNSQENKECYQQQKAQGITVKSIKHYGI